MGNGNTTEERHVVFASDGPNDDGYGSPRSSYRQTRTTMTGSDWDERPVGGRVSRQQTKEWLQYDDVEDDLGQEWQRQQRRRYGSQQPFQTTRRSVTVGPNTRVNRTTSSYFPQRSMMTRSFPSAGYHEERSPSRAFNTRDPDDQWYHYRPEVNRRADWALVGRHVMRPSSAVVRRTSSIPSRLYYDNDSATSDPTSDRLRRGMGPGMVRRTDNPSRTQVGNRTVYWEDDGGGGDATYGRWPGQTSHTYRRPATTYSTYQPYRR